MVLSEAHRQAANEWRGVPTALVEDLLILNERALASHPGDRVWTRARVVKRLCLEARASLGLGVMEKCRLGDGRFEAVGP
jgi:hypothetical protein